MISLRTHKPEMPAHFLPFDISAVGSVSPFDNSFSSIFLTKTSFKKTIVAKYNSFHLEKKEKIS